MEWLIRNAIAAFLVPPGSLLLVLALGLALVRRRRLLGRTLIALGLAGFYALSTPYVADTLLQALEPESVNPTVQAGAQAIVVLGGGTYFNAPEYGANTVHAQVLVRLRYAAHLQRGVGLPVLVTGGSPEGAPVAEAVDMAEVLERDFKIPVRWREERSSTTAENARLSHQILMAAGIRRVYLVTHAWHMPRARLAFENAGLEVVPAATGYATRYRISLLDFVPDAPALRDSSLFFREVIGLVWYRIQFALARWL